MTQAIVPTRVAPPPPGLYPGVSFAEYTSWDALNFHSMMHYAVSPQFARHQMVHGQKTTEALQLGDAAHAAVFSPMLFAESYVGMPDFGNMRLKVNQQLRDSFIADNELAGKQVIPNAEYRHAIGIRDAIERCPLANTLMMSQGLSEVSIVWVQEGMTCKGRVDRIVTMGRDTVVADLKSSRMPWPDTFPKDCKKFRYVAQIATYWHALHILAARRRLANLLAVQNFPPYEISPFWVAEPDLVRHAKRFSSWLKLHKKCSDAGKWPAANPDGTELIISKWDDADLGDWVD